MDDFMSGGSIVMITLAGAAVWAWMTWDRLRR